MARRELTPKQSRFVEEYLRDLNGSAAAKRAGYGKTDDSSRRYAIELLHKPHLAQVIDEAMQRRAERVEVKTDDVLRELLRIAMTDPAEAFAENGAFKPLHEMPISLRRTISSIETDELFDGSGKDRVRIGVTRKLKFWPKVQSLELLGKHLKLFVERHALENPDGSPLDFSAAREAVRAKLLG